jgi:hypothetical protein
MWVVEKFFREKASRNPLHEFAATLQYIPTKGLLDYLCYLFPVGDPDRVQCIRAVFKARIDSYRYNVTFERMLVGFAFADFAELGERFARICHWRRRQTQELRICLPIMVRPSDRRNPRLNSWLCVANWFG